MIELRAWYYRLYRQPSDVSGGPVDTAELEAVTGPEGIAWLTKRHTEDREWRWCRPQYTDVHITNISLEQRTSDGSGWTYAGKDITEWDYGHRHGVDRETHLP